MCEFKHLSARTMLLIHWFSSGLFPVPSAVYSYTNDRRRQHYGRQILKLANDTVIISLLYKNESEHGQVVCEFVKWCRQTFLTDIFNRQVLCKARPIIDCTKHPLHFQLEMLLSGCRFNPSVQMQQEYKLLFYLCNKSAEFAQNLILKIVSGVMLCSIVVVTVRGGICLYWLFLALSLFFVLKVLSFAPVCKSSLSFVITND